MTNIIVFLATWLPVIERETKAMLVLETGAVVGANSTDTYLPCGSVWLFETIPFSQVSANF
jgi:hypothetical protein